MIKITEQIIGARNGLDVSVRTTPTVGAFKKGLKKHTFQSAAEQF
jgi:hypothetical protein